MVLCGSYPLAAQRGWRSLPLPSLLLLLLGCCRCSASGPSISSCGGPNDLLQHAKFTASPDPVEKGTPFTITASGTLSSALSSGSISVDVEAKVLLLEQPIVDDSFKETLPFSYTPGVPAGETQLVIGPVSLPAHVPGSADVTGKLVIEDDKGAQVACIALDFHFAMLSVDSAPALSSTASPHPLGGEANCGKLGDHLSNIRVSHSGGVSEGGGLLDEDISKMTFAADLKLHMGWLPLPVSLEVPVAFLPGLKRGKVWAKVGPATDHATLPESSPGLDVTGKLTWRDALEQEVACMSLDKDLSEAALAAVVV